MWHFFDASFVLYFLFRFPARLQLKYFFENRPLTSVKRLNFSEIPQSDKHISKKLILDMRAVKKNIINRLQLSKLFTARNNHARDFTEEQLYNLKNSYSHPPLFVAYRFCLFTNSIAFFIAMSCRYLFSYARTIRFYSQTFALVFYEFGISSHPLPSF